jgi:hypothetical protein
LGKVGGGHHHQFARNIGEERVLLEIEDKALFERDTLVEDGQGFCAQLAGRQGERRLVMLVFHSLMSAEVMPINQVTNLGRQLEEPWEAELIVCVFEHPSKARDSCRICGYASIFAKQAKLTCIAFLVAQQAALKAAKAVCKYGFASTFAAVVSTLLEFLAHLTSAAVRK